MSIASDGKKFAQTPRKSIGRRALYCCQHISFIVSNKILHHDSDAIAPSSWFTNEYVFEIVHLLWHKNTSFESSTRTWQERCHRLIRSTHDFRLPHIAIRCYTMLYDAIRLFIVLYHAIWCYIVLYTVLSNANRVLYVYFFRSCSPAETLQACLCEHAVRSACVGCNVFLGVRKCA